MAAANSSKLINTLQALTLCDNNPSQQHFAQKLGDLLDLPDAFVVADNLRGLKRMPFKEANSPCESEPIQQQFLNDKKALEQTLIEKIQQHSRFDNKQPESYSRFYSLCQSELEQAIVKIRKPIINQLKQSSVRMARLVFLDELLHDKLGAQLRSFYSVLPKLVEKHFAALQAPEQQPDMISLGQTHSNPWPQQLKQDIQHLLLAELELRLQPLVGLIEAIDENIETNS